MFHYTYKTINVLNSKYYYGIHSTDNLNDGYKGSGRLLKKAFVKYGRKNFKTEILEFFDSREQLVDAEKLLITKEMVDSDDCYNLNFGGENTLGVHSDQTKLKISLKNKGENNPRFGAKWDESEKHKLAGFKNRKHTKESIDKMIESRTGLTRSDETKSLMSKNHGTKIRKPVYYLDENGNKIIFESAADASKNTKFDAGGIRQSIKKGYLHKNKLWFYV